MRETEERLTDFQGQYNALTRSYGTLHLGYSAVQQELESVQNQYES
jgi:septation ring formation regulator EzrA